MPRARVTVNSSVAGRHAWVTPIRGGFDAPQHQARQRPALDPRAAPLQGRIRERAHRAGADHGRVPERPRQPLEQRLGPQRPRVREHDHEILGPGSRATSSAAICSPASASSPGQVRDQEGLGREARLGQHRDRGPALVLAARGQHPVDGGPDDGPGAEHLGGGGQQGRQLGGVARCREQQRRLGATHGREGAFRGLPAGGPGVAARSRDRLRLGAWPEYKSRGAGGRAGFPVLVRLG